MSRNLPYRAGAGDRSPCERGQRRVERLQRAERGDVEPGDDAAGRALAQERGERLDLGQFRHAVQYARIRGAAPCSPGWAGRLVSPSVSRGRALHVPLIRSAGLDGRSGLQRFGVACGQSSGASGRVGHSVCCNLCARLLDAGRLYMLCSRCKETWSGLPVVSIRAVRRRQVTTPVVP